MEILKVNRPPTDSFKYYHQCTSAPLTVQSRVHMPNIAKLEFETKYLMF